MYRIAQYSCIDSHLCSSYGTYYIYTWTEYSYRVLMIEVHMPIYMYLDFIIQYQLNLIEWIGYVSAIISYLLFEIFVILCNVYSH